ncbi:HNH endonuclease signature motif containing protein [Microbispora sp. H10670]|uniref:HNH endonuclease signature motif containing protein n=1 Tax=Microbispora sp. H10670 TaxID=2729108 RepID=UPI001603BC39|nr:HNH endonuclease signature motif containing protein [Microbispora sp. H10670]
MAAVGEAARAVALVPVPESAEVCLAEAEELLSARDRITSALAARVGLVHRAGEARNHGHASTRLWLRSVGGMTIPGAGRLVTMGVELGRLSRVRERFAEGSLPEGIVEAICTATAGLTDDQATTAEGILLELAGSAGAAEVAKAGRYLRAVLDPDGHENDEQADFDRRFFRVRRRRNGGLEGEFYLPVEAAARLQHLLDVYAKPKAEGDDRTLSVRNADAVIAFLDNKIATELLVLVTAESLPNDPPAGHPTSDPSGTDPSGDHPTSDPSDTDPSDGPGPGPGPDLGSCGPGSVPGADACVSEDFGTPYAGTTDAGSEPSAPEHPATGGPAVVWPHFDAAHGDERAALGEVGEVGEVDDTRQGHADEAETHRHRAWYPQRTRAQQTHAPDPPTEPPTKSDDATGAHTEDGPSGDRPGDRRAHGCPGEDRPADDCPADDCPADDCPTEGYRHASWTGEARHETSRTGADAPPGVERDDDAWPGVGVNSPPPGVWLRGLPGLILATGQLLPVASVHRLARTSTLVRIVMDAGGQVLDMGRKVRLATPAQRRAVFARYAICWVDGCPLPATMCQVDHAEDWCSGGLTDLKLLGPACQFHNRDRYRHPNRYTRRKIGDDRWAFTYRNPRDSRNPRSARRRL